ncbi:ExbD/TolR family protein [Roseibacillus ishigakijimensis]|uniref:Biopolymer transporter ExbD n=1 Tax=Roseibacillus ishigakijimensis TaxID=454146 RepID=A0A934RTZ9_9BACT|nr:biopolymer transporter ExbD [Roseibacillus ishigakijimensis]MBK1835393.1 hypothetical protein [Roseibacillus ishigakijimensis]
MVNVSLTLDEKPGPLHALAALDIVVLVMLLGFVAGTLVHQAGVVVELPRSDSRFAVPEESLVLTVKGVIEPSFYVGAKRISRAELPGYLERRRDEEGLRMVLIRADRRLPATFASQLSELILKEDLECAWVGEPALDGGRELFPSEEGGQ